VNSGDSVTVRRLLRILLWIGVGLVVTLVLAVSWLWTADLGFVEPRVERLLTEMSGRRFDIEGGLAIDVDDKIVVVARDVRWENASWDNSPYMLRVGYVEVHVDPWSLFKRIIAFEYIELSDADVIVTRNADGRLNWDVFPRAAAPKPEADEGGIGILLRKVDVDDVGVVFTSPERDRPVRIALRRLDQDFRDDEILDLSLSGTLGNQSVSIDGEVGTWTAIQAGQDIRFDFDGQIGSLEWSGNGHIDDLARLRRPTLEFSAQSPSLGELMQMLGLDQPAEGGIDVKATLEPADGGPLNLDVDGRVGQAEIEATGVFSDLAALDRMDFELLASGPDLGRVLRLAGIHQVREGPFMIDVDASRDGSEFIVNQAKMVYGDTEFLLSARLPNFPTLDDGRIDLSAAGPDIERFRYMTGLPGAAIGRFSIDFELEVRPDGTETVTLDVRTSLGHVQASGELGDAPDYVGTTLDIAFDGDSLAAFEDVIGLDRLPDVPLQAAGSLELEDGAIRTLKPATLRLGDGRASVDGRFVFSEEFKASGIRVDAQGPDLAAAVAGFADVTGIPPEPFDLGGRLSIDRTALDFSGVNGTLGSNELSADGRLVFAPGLAGSRAKFSASGPAFEELLASLADVTVHPGAFSLSGRSSLGADQLTIEDFQLERDRASVTLDVELGLPLSRRWADVAVTGEGSDVRALLAGMSGFEANEQPFTLKSRAALRSDEIAISRLNVTVGDASLSGQGTLGLGDQSRRSDLSISGRIPNLRALGSLAGREFNEQSVSWAFGATGEDGRFDVDDLVIEIGDSDLQGSVSYVSGEIPVIDARFSSDELFIEPLFETQDVEIEPVAERDDGRLIPDWPLPLEPMKRLDVSVRAEIGEFHGGGLYLENVLLDASLENGALEVREFGLDARSGRLQSRASLEPAEGGAVTAVELVARDLAFGLSETNRDLKRTGDIDLNLEFVGDDLRSMLAGANGILLVEMRGGAVGNNAFLRALYGDVLQQILSVINPFYDANAPTALDCMVAPFVVEAGQLTAEPQIVVRTGKLNMFVKPSVNLKSEKLDLSVRTMPRKGISISTAELFNPYVKVVGTLGAPALAVDEQGVLITGGAAVATGGLSILAKAAWDRLIRSAEPCEETRNAAHESLAARLPDIEFERRPPAATEGEK